ncbi:uncharacterized protein LOC126894506 [Daktulosphaira vitifoliae]|uniref:uncharacterized protein LOC126894506 n=1 Tax=Daktulosphaira vitifoliae TaxID=58002 RepID=UPI0021AA09C1|nr:uncharacterized protein LOC126894506 [Daktulosphaira vitifoliae]
MVYKQTILFLTVISVSFVFLQVLNVNNMNPIRHEMRIPIHKWNANSSFLNSFFMDVKQYYDVQYFHINFSTRIPFMIYRLSVEVIKCKEHFIDCVNLRSFDILDICDKIDATMLFLLIGYKNRDVRCPIKGEYVWKNMSFSTLSIQTISAPTEKWWENSYKLKLCFYDKYNVEVLYVEGSAYFLTFRRRKNKNLN